MSHRHSAQLQMYNNTEATIDKIWKTVENVWNETSSSEVARAFVLAYRVMDVIMATMTSYQMEPHIAMFAGTIKIPRLASSQY